MRRVQTERGGLVNSVYMLYFYFSFIIPCLFLVMQDGVVQTGFGALLELDMGSASKGNTHLDKILAVFYMVIAFDFWRNVDYDLGLVLCELLCLCVQCHGDKNIFNQLIRYMILDT